MRGGGLCSSRRWTAACTQGPPTQNGEPVNGRDILAQPLPDNAQLIGLLGEITYLHYLQETQGLSPTVESVALPTDPASARIAAVERALAEGKRPFLTRELPGAGERWTLSALGPLIEVQATPQTQPPAALWPLGLPLGEAVTLAAWTRSPIADSTGERLTLAWRVNAPLTDSLKVSARLVGAGGETLAQQDQIPVHNAYPTTLWQPGSVLLDSYTLPAPPAGAHYLVILYRAADGSEIARAEWQP